MNWDKITKDDKVKQLLIVRAYIEEEIKRLDENALIMYELEVLSIPDVVVQSEQLKAFAEYLDEMHGGEDFAVNEIDNFMKSL